MNEGAATNKTTPGGSATGNSRRTRDLGLTLLETLIVLAVIAIVSGATALTLAPRHGNATEVEARVLATTIQAAVDRSIVTGSRDVLVVDDRGYGLRGGVYHPLPAGTTLAGAGDGDLSLGFDDGLPFDLIVSAGSDRWTVSFDGLRTAVARGAA